MQRRFVYIGLIIALTGCAGSPGWYVHHPDKQIYMADGYEIATVPIDANTYSAYASRVTGSFDALDMRKFGIEAIEKRSQCKVISDMMEPPRAIGIGWILHTKVECK